MFYVFLARRHNKVIILSIATIVRIGIRPGTVFALVRIHERRNRVRYPTEEIAITRYQSFGKGLTDVAMAAYAQ